MKTPAVHKHSKAESGVLCSSKSAPAKANTPSPPTAQSDPGPGQAAGPLRPAGAPLRRRQKPRREEEGDHRDRARPAKIAYQVLKSGVPYQDLGADFYTRRESPEHKQAWLERQLQRLHPDCTITITISPPEAALAPGA